MSKAIPTIGKFMTTTPSTIACDQSLEQARKLMHDLTIRHLPVLKGGKVVGIISERDISLMQSISGIDLHKEKVEQAMSLDPVLVEAETPLDVICREMAAKKIGSILVQDNHKLVGIFTWIDALNAMDELLKTRLSK